MKKKLLTVLMALALSVSVLPASITPVSASEIADVEGEIPDDDDEEADPSTTEIIKDDLIVKPAKKTIKIGQSFYISLAAALDSDYEDLPDEEWEEVLENNIDSITFRSTKTSVASVNSRTGKVKGLRKGNAVIKTTVNLANGQTVTFKTKVYVTR